MAEVKTGLEGVLKLKWGQTGTASVAAGSTIGYVTGMSIDYSPNPIHIYDKADYSHSKAQRVHGKASVKSLYVNDDFRTKLGTSTASESYGRHYMELQVDGVAGTLEDVYSFENCALESFAVDVPEETEMSQDWGFHFNYYRRLSAANKLIT